MEAIAVFGELSTLDEPLIMVFDQLEGLGLAHNAAILESFGAAVKEILTHVPNSLVVLNLFPDRWEQFDIVCGAFDVQSRRVRIMCSSRTPANRSD